ncbi:MULTISPECIES: response regulator [unclassified Sphingomonas]|uniref:response regulator n=1 Tax=Novosphingobium rhizosphaerae TaxID=1551649 RepID=UPI0015C9B3CE
MSTPLRIVVAEDDALIAMYLEELLIAMGHDVCAIAHSESETVKAAGLCRPDLMIVDGSLHGGSGVSAMRRIQAAQGFVPHVYVTGNTLAIAESVERAIIVCKPFNMEELEQAIAQAVPTRPHVLP